MKTPVVGSFVRTVLCLPSVTHQLRWPPFCSRILMVLMITTTTNIFFCDITRCITATVGVESGEERGEKKQRRRA